MSYQQRKSILTGNQIVDLSNLANLPQMHPSEELAIDAVVNVINQTKTRFGERQNLFQLAQSRGALGTDVKVPLKSLRNPLPHTGQKLIEETIERKWHLTPTFYYNVRYSGSSQNECATYYYFEAVFSQPSVYYPVPQVSVSVFFTVEEKQLDPVNEARAPTMNFRVEGSHSDHDVRFVFLTVDMILALMQMKLKVFKRIEALKLF